MILSYWIMNLKKIWIEINREIQINNNLYGEIIQTDNTNKLKKTYSLDENYYKELFKFYRDNLIKKFRGEIQMLQNDNLYVFVNKLFLCGVKYYNCFDKIKILENQLKHIGLPKNYKDDYSLFYPIYEESYKLRHIYREQKKGYDNSNYDEEEKRFFNETLKK